MLNNLMPFLVQWGVTSLRSGWQTFPNRSEPPLDFISASRSAVSREVARMRLEDTKSSSFIPLGKAARYRRELRSLRQAFWRAFSVAVRCRAASLNVRFGWPLRRGSQFEDIRRCPSSE